MKRISTLFDKMSYKTHYTWMSKAVDKSKKTGQPDLIVALRPWFPVNNQMANQVAKRLKVERVNKRYFYITTRQREEFSVPTTEEVMERVACHAKVEVSELVDLLAYTNGFISGPFLLKILLNDPHPGKLTVYVPNNDVDIRDWTAARWSMGLKSKRSHHPAISRFQVCEEITFAMLRLHTGDDLISSLLFPVAKCVLTSDRLIVDEKALSEIRDGVTSLEWTGTLKLHLLSYLVNRIAPLLQLKKTVEGDCAICFEKTTTKPPSLTKRRVGNLHRLTCGHIFHENCIEKWGHCRRGDFIIPSKQCCPSCKQSTIPRQWIIEISDKSNLYRICKRCVKPFAAGPVSCESHMDQMPDKCELCREGVVVVECPKCHLQLEHSGGCLEFSCCLYGSDGCQGSRCSHGSTEGVKFCGNRWSIRSYQTTHSW